MTAPPTNTQSCEATLTIAGVPYEGKTGANKGHAEMTALHDFLLGQPSIAQAIVVLQGDNMKSVSCPSRPVCVKCSAVLRGLGFRHAADTSWSTKKMEPTEWGVTLKVRDLLKAAGISYEGVKGLA